VDVKGKLLYIFWADVTSRKNYSHFGDLMPFDSTYSTNQYNMKFAPFTRVNHHMQSVIFGVAFLVDDRIKSYEWYFQPFLEAMGGKAPRLIITDEDASMKSAIRSILPGIFHRLCMWHIMEKFPDKFRPPVKHDESFWSRLNACVWGSETGDEFEMQWNSIITDFCLQENEWLGNRFLIHKSWITTYFIDIPLVGVLRTTS
jgi:hypothetical protein